MECDGRECGQGKYYNGSNKYICPHNNLEALFPNLVAEWSPGNKKEMCEYLPTSTIRAQWVCSKNKTCECHIWSAVINSRTKSNPTGCPYCANQKLCEHNNLKVMHPELIDQWHPNNPPMDHFFPTCKEKALWICPINSCGCHIYQATIGSRTSKKPSGCPYCINVKLCDHNNLEYMCPELKKEWHPDNPPMNSYSPGSKAVVKWKCSNENICECHIWEINIYCRTGPSKTGCPYCNHNKTCPHNNLEINYPELKKEWHSENKNMSKYTSCSDDIVKWICKKNSHVWTSSIGARTGKKSGCPYCNNKTEDILFEYLSIIYDHEIKRQKKFEWCKNILFLPFDFCIEELKLLIELDGPQHFKQISNWQHPLLTQEIDKYKMKYANENGYSVIRILQDDIWNDKNNWDDNLEQSIKKYDKPINIFLGDCYDNYKNLDKIVDEELEDMINEINSTITSHISTKSNIKKTIKLKSKVTKHDQPIINISDDINNSNSIEEFFDKDNKIIKPSHKPLYKSNITHNRLANIKSATNNINVTQVNTQSDKAEKHCCNFINLDDEIIPNNESQIDTDKIDRDVRNIPVIKTPNRKIIVKKSDTNKKYIG